MSKDRLIGRLEWEITEREGCRVIEEGATDVRLEDVEFRHYAGIASVIPIVRNFWKTDHVTRSVRIGDVFEFSLAGDYSVEGPLSSFALCVPRTDDVHAFSFEYFKIDALGHASKFHESGELGIKVLRVDPRWELVKTEFLTDVTLRAVPMGFSMLKLTQQGIDINIKWFVKIKRGSVMNWPSRIGEHTISHGYID